MENREIAQETEKMHQGKEGGIDLSNNFFSCLFTMNNLCSTSTSPASYSFHGMTRLCTQGEANGEMQTLSDAGRQRSVLLSVLKAR